MTKLLKIVNGPFSSSMVLTLIVLIPLANAGLQAQTTQLAAANSTVSSAATLPDDPSTAETAQSFNEGFGRAVKTIGHDELYFLKYPFQKKAIKWDILFLGATAALISTDENVLHQVPQSWHNTSLTLSNAALGADAGIATGIFLTGLATNNEHAKETGIRTAEATIDSVILYGAAKAVFARQRPFTGTGEGNFFSGNWTNGSFPSGHSMLTWTIASTVAHEYHSPWLKVLVYGLATTVSTTRVTGREHFPSDVFVGGVLGYGIGAYVAHRDSYGNTQGHPYPEGRLKRAENAVLEHVTIQ